MDERLRLGFHRIGRPLEDGVNLGIALIAAWALIVLTIAIGGGLGFAAGVLVFVAGAAAVVLLRDAVEALARAWRRRRIALERDYTGPDPS